MIIKAGLGGAVTPSYVSAIIASLLLHGWRRDGNNPQKTKVNMSKFFPILPPGPLYHLAKFSEIYYNELLMKSTKIHNVNLNNYLVGG